MPPCTAAAVQPSRRAAPLPRAPRGAGRGRLNHGQNPVHWTGAARRPCLLTWRAGRRHARMWTRGWILLLRPLQRDGEPSTRAHVDSGGEEGRGGGGKYAIRRRGDSSCRPPAGGGPRMLPRPEPAEAPVGVPVLSRGVPACRPLPAAQGGQEAPAVPLPMRRMIRAPNPDGRVRLCIPSRA